MINPELYSAAEAVVDILKEKNLTLSVAESCTGGMVSCYLTEISGVSKVFPLGITSYTCEIKNEVLGVCWETLEKYGAVSNATAKEMAEKVLVKGKTDIGASVTGVAGPESSEGHPAGYLFIAVSGEKGTKVNLLNIEPLNRNFVREQAVLSLFELIKNYAKELKNE